MYLKYATVKLLRLMVNCVGAGSAWPKLENSSAKTGITKINSTAVTPTATVTIVAG